MSKGTAPMKRHGSKSVRGKGLPEGRAFSLCANKDCKLKKEAGCKGFEACPGYKGR
ncbi:MAG: hypothetical protein AB1805_11235 [Nitrospirota bacterium]